MKGKFIVLYGINNLGKSTQLELLKEFLSDTTGRLCVSIKYPLYELKPTGHIINGYMRQGNPYQLSAREFQIFQAMNRTHYNNACLKDMLSRGTHVLAEDYVGTSVAWGMGAGVDRSFLEYINSHLVKPDIAILLDGERFREGIETGHTHESDDELTQRVRKHHLILAQDEAWFVVDANQPIQTVHKSIVNHVLSHIV